jgi:prefoldin subunit 5
MTPSSSKINERIEDLEQEIEELQRQKYLIQSQYDFADFIETHNLIEKEIERLRQEIKEERTRLANSEATDSKRDIEEIKEEEEGEKEIPLSHRDII